MTTPAVLQPLAVRGVRLKNRMVGLPLGLSGYVDHVGSPTERSIALYGRRAQGGAAMVTVEATYTGPPPVDRRGLLGFHTDDQIPAFSLLAGAIQSAGAVASLQITNTWHTNFPYDLEDLTVAQIEAAMDHVALGAGRAVAAGFDAVELQAAHGWPMARFLSPLFNRRHDRYGDHDYVLAETIRRMRFAVGDAVLVSVRLSIVESPVEGRAGNTIERTIAHLCPAAESAGADLLSLTFGQGPIAPDLQDYRATEILYIEPGDKFDLLRQVKDTVAVPVIGRSRITDPDLAERAIVDGAVDLVGLGRQLLADPDFPAKIADGATDDIVKCIGCDFCSGGVGAKGRTLHCAVNHETGRELDIGWSSRRIRRAKKVLVAGAGPAGMEAALGLADLGCDVVLIERRDELGGLLAAAARLPALRLADLAHLIENQTKRLRRSAVTVCLEQELTAEVVASAEPEAVVLATGSHPEEPMARPDDPSAPRVVTVAAYLDGAAVGPRVVVDGHGEGAEIAVSLARQGRAVTLVEGAYRLAPLVYDYSTRRLEALNDYLVEDGVACLWASRVSGLGPGTVVVDDRAGRTVTVVADTLVVAGRRVPPSIDGLGVDVVVEIGDRRSPRGVGEALAEARAAANSIAR